MIIHNCEQGSEAWHEARLGRFTGSSHGNLHSGKSTATYQNIIANIAAEIITHDTEENYVSDAMQRGTDLEPEARKFYEALTGFEVEQVGFIEPDGEFEDWAGMSPDGLIDQDGLLEIKCPLAKTMFKYYKDNKLPSEYKWQVYFQLYISGRAWCDFFAYFPGMKPFIIRVYPDQEIYKEIETELRIAINAVKELIQTYNEYEAGI